MKRKLIVVTKRAIAINEIRVNELNNKELIEKNNYLPIIIYMNNIGDIIDIINSDETFDVYLNDISNEDTINVMISILHTNIISGSYLDNIYTNGRKLNLPKEIWGRAIELLRNDNEFYRALHSKFSDDSKFPKTIIF